MKVQNDYPLKWPAGQPRTKNPQPSRFRNVEGHRPRADKARLEIVREIKLLGGDRVSISSNSRVKVDGELSGARQVITDRGVAVYWNLGDQRKVLACDKWETLGENLHAIAKTIEASRGIERWGSVTTEQAFAGYTALPEKTQASCWELLDIRDLSGEDTSNPTIKAMCESMILTAYRKRAGETHPDKLSGSHETFAAVVAAKDMALQLINQ